MVYAAAGVVAVAMLIVFVPGSSAFVEILRHRVPCPVRPDDRARVSAHDAGELVVERIGRYRLAVDRGGEPALQPVRPVAHGAELERQLYAGGARLDRIQLRAVQLEVDHLVRESDRRVREADRSVERLRVVEGRSQAQGDHGDRVVDAPALAVNIRDRDLDLVCAADQVLRDLNREISLVDGLRLFLRAVHGDHQLAVAGGQLVLQ